MKQVVQSARSGKLSLKDVPEPGVKSGHLLVRTRTSLISAGTRPGSGESTAYGMELPGVVAGLMRELTNVGSQPTVTAGARRVTVGQRMSTGGARFVRP